MHEYPIQYFQMSREPFDATQLEHLLDCERVAGVVQGDTGYDGLKVDFNFGVRVQVPEGDWHVRILDYNSGIIGFEADVSQKVLISAEKFFVRWQVQIFRAGALVFDHVLDLQDEKVLVFITGSALGDTIALLPYLNYFRDFYHCRVSVLLAEPFHDIVRLYYPEINLLTDMSEEFYASYCLGTFHVTPYMTPTNSRCITPDITAQAILGLPERCEKVVYYPTRQRVVEGKYVCVAVQASGIMKRWLYPQGWDTVTAYLHKLGYRVLCIDADNYFSDGGYSAGIPAGAEDFTGRKPLLDRINLLAYADFFIGLGSGLSWLANACNIPVIIISGFSLPLGEFDTSYRVTNLLVCHGCYNDIRVDWKDYCPYHLGTEREYECSKSISPGMVIEAIERLLSDKCRRSKKASSEEN